MKEENRSLRAQIAQLRYGSTSLVLSVVSLPLVLSVVFRSEAPASTDKQVEEKMTELTHFKAKLDTLRHEVTSRQIALEG